MALYSCHGRLDGIAQCRGNGPFRASLEQAQDEVPFIVLHDDLHGVAPIQGVETLGGIGQFGIDAGQGGIEQAQADNDLIVEQGQMELRWRA